ncbi:signal transduction histidine kinase [Allocatelliglobosispora scoriae]|uniref:histidine kinase n=1 Tax=Allocatelliglobosispora scoriae TaxID=643052 RepID=A0A841BJH8_9ACTN|nr:HAMP domain-containing sensor histidine kinase [Allocatelliglobosispora scoriae]MBB5867785.1 signal transduction histidine kinase [Allocatelliglobosispora scoriae]
MWDTASTRTSRLIRLAWLLGAGACATAMYLLPGREAIPFHLIWMGLYLVYGFTAWRPLEMMVTVAATAAVTGTILIAHAVQGAIDWPGTAEVPLSVAVTAVIALYLRRRHLATAELARIAERDRRRAEIRHLLVQQVSHELRTPITIARGYTELVRVRLTEPDGLRDADIVLDELDKLNTIADRLVTFIQIDGESTPQTLEMRPELERIVRRWQPAAKREWTVRASAGQIHVSRERLETALDCLIDNAVKFTGTGDAIELIGAIAPDEWTIEVVDTGCGMSAANASALATGQAVERGAASGTGLGLPTVRTIVGAWGGAVHLRSEPGRGTSVLLRFPRRHDDALLDSAIADRRP